MKTILFLIGLIPLFLQAQQKLIVYDERAELRTVSAFTEIRVEGGIDVYLSPDPIQKLVVSAATDAFRNNIITEVDGKQLRIYQRSDRKGSSGVNKKMKVYISAPVLEKIVAIGASDVFVQGVLKGKVLNLQLSGASDFAGAVEVDQLVISQSGSSDARLNGKAKSMDIVLSGASDLKGFDCRANAVKAYVSGASKLEITVDEELSVMASGASDVIYKGKGVIKKQTVSGASTLKALDSERL